MLLVIDLINTYNAAVATHQHIGDLVDRPQEHADEQQEADEAAGREAAVQHEPGARHHDQHLDEPRAEIGQR